MISIFRHALWSLTIGYASLAAAVSIYDVIELSRQGYSDEELVKVIGSTRSAFELVAADIPRLKKLGVSETVIRAMLASAPPEPSEIEPIRRGAPGLTIPSADPAVANRPSTDDVQVEEVYPTTAGGYSVAGEHGYAVLSPIMPDQFSIQVVSEEAAGDHEHVYLTLNRFPILMLRDEARHPTIESRGRAVARNLQQAAGMGEGRFRALRYNGVDVVVFHGVDSREVPIITVNHHDAHAYDVRSERRVTPDLLAAYWTALLNDYWAIAFLRRPPTRLVHLHRGDALTLLFELVDETEPGDAVDLRSAIQQLPGAIQSHLERLAKAVPDDFDSPRAYLRKAS